MAAPFGSNILRIGLTHPLHGQPSGARTLVRPGSSLARKVAKGFVEPDIPDSSLDNDEEARRIVTLRFAMHFSFQSRDGFTAIEVIMTISLIAGVLALVVFNFYSFEGALDDRPALAQVNRAVAEGHRLAREKKAPVLMRYSEEEESMVLFDKSGGELARFDFPKGGEAEIAFYPLLPEEEIREEPDFEPEEEPVGFVVFEPYGVTAPFQLQLDTDSRSTSIRYDPFSGIGWERTDLL